MGARPQGPAIQRRDTSGSRQRRAEIYIRLSQPESGSKAYQRAKSQPKDMLPLIVKIK